MLAEFVAVRRNCFRNRLQNCFRIFLVTLIVSLISSPAHRSASVLVLLHLRVSRLADSSLSLSVKKEATTRLAGYSRCFHWDSLAFMLPLQMERTRERVLSQTQAVSVPRLSILRLLGACSTFARATVLTSSVLSVCSQRDYAPALTAYKRKPEAESQRLAGVRLFARARVTVRCAAAKVDGMEEARVPACAETSLAATVTAPKKRKADDNECASGSSSTHKRGRLSQSACYRLWCCSVDDSSCQASDTSKPVTRRKKPRKRKTMLCRSWPSFSVLFGLLSRALAGSLAV